MLSESHPLRRRLVAAAAAALCALLLTGCVGPTRSTPSRIVVIGDVHGAYDTVVQLLRAARLVDAEKRWVGGSAALVQLGDLIGRGPDDRAVLDLFMALPEQAEAAGGRVEVVLGNHEVLNIHGDLRYVSQESFRSFAGRRAERRRAAAYKRLGRVKPPVEMTQEEFFDKYPIGYLEHRDAFGPKGHYGRWLRDRPALVRIRDIVFMHGGLDAGLAQRGVRAINAQIRTELAFFDVARADLVRRRRIAAFADLEAVLAAARAELEIGRVEGQERQRLEQLALYSSWLSNHPRGPLWFRGFAKWSEAELVQHLPTLRNATGATQLVVGHTPQLSNGIVQRRGYIFLVDTGMLGAPFYPGGAAYALEIQGGQFTQIDVRGGRKRLTISATDRAARRSN